MEPWTQNYDPLGNILISAFIAFIPILFFFLSLTLFKIRGYLASLITVFLAIAIAIFVYQMPIATAMAAAFYGIVYGLWPVASIIIAALFLYNLAVETGNFKMIRSSITSLTTDQRLQLLLIGFAFGAFLEGAAGFGAPVAITSALLAGMGFNPIHAAGLCLISNMAPGAFGAMGIPVLIAGQITGYDPLYIGQFAVRQLPLLQLVVPFLLIYIMDGIRGWKETWPAILLCGGTFTVTQFIIVHFIGSELADVTAASITLLVLTFFFNIWKPKRIFQYDENPLPIDDELHPHRPYTNLELVRAWSPFIILTIVISLWSMRPFKQLFAKGGPLETTVLNIPIPYLHNLVLKTHPIVSTTTPYGAIFKLDLLAATSTAILLAALISCFIFRFPAASALKLLGKTIKSLLPSILTICSVLAFAFVANYSGLSSTLGLALSATGNLFPFFSPFLGWMGVFLTGSVMSSNALFGTLQSITAQQIHVNPLLLVAANIVGGVTAKMISPQSIAVASAAVNLTGRESELFRFTVKYSLVFAILIGVLTYLQAHWLGWMLP